MLRINRIFFENAGFLFKKIRYLSRFHLKDHQNMLECKRIYKIGNT